MSVSRGSGGDGAAVVGSPSGPVSAFEAAVIRASKAGPAGTADPLVSLAFALGWQMAELYRPKLRRRHQRHDDDLPGLGSLGDDERTQISVDQIQAAVSKLAPSIKAAGLPDISVDDLRDSLGKDPPEFVRAVEAVHLQLLGELTAADFRLGKAYGLGRAFADTCRKPSDGAGVKKQQRTRWPHGRRLRRAKSSAASRC